MSVRAWLTLIGSVQVRPPLVDIEKAMSLCLNLLKRPSHQTRYRLPLLGSAAKSARVSPARTGAPVSGSLTSNVWMVGPMMGSDQVAPWSVERRMAREFCPAFAGWLPEPFIRV